MKMKGAAGAQGAAKMSEKDLKAAWKAAYEKRGENSGFDIADGNYNAIVTGYELGVKEKTNVPQLTMDYKIIGSDEADKTKKVWLTFDPSNETQMQIAIDTLFKFGVEVEDPSQLEDALPILKGRLVEIKIKSKDGYSNLYIKRVVPEDEAETIKQELGIEEDAPAKKKTAVKEKTTTAAAPAGAPEVEEEVEITVGMAVLAHTKLGDKKAHITQILEDEGKVLVTLDDDKTKTPKKIGLEKLEPITENDAANEPEEL